jgi:quercetin dioxygenase-like cupin family protein
MSFATEQEIAKLKASDQWHRERRAALTLLKTPALTIVLLALHAGAVLKEHHAEGSITIMVLEGAIRFKVFDEERVLRRGAYSEKSKLVYEMIEPYVPRAVQA